MNDSQIEDRPDSDKEWSEMDLYDLAVAVRMDDSVEFIASFLRRSPREVRDKIAELERSGDLRRLIERISAFIAIDEDELF